MSPKYYNGTGCLRLLKKVRGEITENDAEERCLENTCLASWRSHRRAAFNPTSSPPLAVTSHSLVRQVDGRLLLHFFPSSSKSAFRLVYTALSPLSGQLTNGALRSAPNFAENVANESCLDFLGPRGAFQSLTASFIQTDYWILTYGAVCSRTKMHHVIYSCAVTVKNSPGLRILVLTHAGSWCPAIVSGDLLKS